MSWVKKNDIKIGDFLENMSVFDQEVGTTLPKGALQFKIVLADTKKKN